MVVNIWFSEETEGACYGPLRDSTDTSAVASLGARPAVLAVESRSSNESLFVSTEKRQMAEAKKKLRVLIVDDHEAVRRGLKSAVIGTGWDVCGEAINGKEAIEMARELQPDVVVLDISMPVMGGLEAAPHIRKAAPQAKVVAFTMHESQQIRNEVSRLGVHGLAVKSAPLSNLLETVKSVVAS
jgi:CheY-like chemotaxis protein